jgi:hypothetical protein
MRRYFFDLYKAIHVAATLRLRNFKVVSLKMSQSEASGYKKLLLVLDCQMQRNVRFATPAQMDPFVVKGVEFFCRETGNPSFFLA